MKQQLTKGLLALRLSIFSLTASCSSAIDASPCPSDFAEQVYEQLKTQISWVDINFEPNPSKMTIRYYPCYPSRALIDELLKDALTKTAPDCLLVSLGKHRHKEGYCALEHVIVAAR